MIEANVHGADKFFHCMANCEATQRGPLGERAAELLSDIREFSDGIVNRFRGVSPAAIQQDTEADQAANRHGRDGVRDNPNRPCDEICGVFRPGGM
jgi:hypothetical protein